MNIGEIQTYCGLDKTTEGLLQTRKVVRNGVGIYEWNYNNSSWSSDPIPWNIYNMFFNMD